MPETKVEQSIMQLKEQLLDVLVSKYAVSQHETAAVEHLLAAYFWEGKLQGLRESRGIYAAGPAGTVH